MRRGRCATAALEMADSRRTPQQQTLSAMFTRSALQNTPSTGSSTGAAGAAAASRRQRPPGSLLAENEENLRRERETLQRIKNNQALQRAERLQRGGMPKNAPSQGSLRVLKVQRVPLLRVRGCSCYTRLYSCARRCAEAVGHDVHRGPSWCPRSSSALAGDHQHLDEGLKSCAVGSVQGSGRGLVQVPMWRQSRSLQQTG